MWDRIRNCWVPRLCFTATLGLAVVLALLVGVSPLLCREHEAPQLLELFAGDATVRRVALAAAAGLAVTAFVFFRPTQPKKPTPKESPPRTMAGA